MFKIFGIPEQLSNKLLKLVSLISVLIFIVSMVNGEFYVNFDPSTGSTFQPFTGALVPYGNYCNIRHNHVMCHFGDELGKDCKGEAVHVPITNRERHLILYQHNMWRNKVAGGDYANDKIQVFGISGEMFELTWDYELEILAQRWANQCIPYHYDANRDTFQYNVAQNVYSGCFYGHYDLDAEYILKFWGEDQIKHMTLEAWRGKANRLFPEVNQVINLVWSDIRRMGCARRLMKVSDRPEYRIYFVCNYSPAGNLREKYPYFKRDKPCKKCLCLHPYPNLCVADSPRFTLVVGQKKQLDRVESGANSTTAFLQFLLPLAFLLIHALM